MNSNGPDSYRKQRAAYIELASNGIGADTFITLVTNQTWELSKMQRAIKAFVGCTDHSLLGKKWWQMPVDCRTEGIFFIEHVASNTHAHGMLRLPQRHQDDQRDIKILLEQHWNKLTPGGSLDFQTLHDAVGCADYCTKEMQFEHFRDEQIVCTWDFAKRQN